MSRDPRDDYYDNDPDRAERERGSDDGRSERDSRVVEKARAKVGAPGMFLILNGLFGLVVVAVLSVPLVFQPEMVVKAGRDLAVQQPPGPDRQNLEQQMDEAEKEIQQNRTALQIKNLVQLGILALGNLLAIVGGFRMRGLGSYGLSMAGAIASLIPILTGCCCTGTVFGLWSLIVLLQPDVKAGFAARRRAAYSPDRY
ncbi:Uncharacterized protein OS=Myxococcus stipitatus (strain DSM 14675 / JCM 12634 / Mx s8) GN=MYSTI_01649 PE=4 SV=1 [Gemmata massiliana]|uniref:Uncharacterized protein n=1 Tax=Gemmata massiliana TaxID=1210884 RepID=A0A6P2CP29_9BACT|nr:hypothetical protein [Gemmata massiliana]VTR90768.1 Uncharacterized protein OS=Myxococcus stipitatus (strain DSM 14675 / JCM 12634 / Mx s8) GN=MYSTI_01649 PE=4 SV=1 [Gemmata massiliana]